MKSVIFLQRKYARTWEYLQRNKHRSLFRQQRLNLLINHLRPRRAAVLSLRLPPCGFVPSCQSNKTPASIGFLGLAQVQLPALSQLPISQINFSDPADKSRHDRMVELVERMLALHKQLAAAKIEHEKTALQRQIETTDRQIDALVYELYGLTEEEIKIVEGRE
jgi:hypothetical protein